MRDIVLAGIAGLLAGFLVFRKREKNGHPKDKPIAEFLTAFLEPIYFWLDLNGLDGNPAHGKVIYFGGAIFFLGMNVSFGFRQLASGLGVTWELVGQTSITMAYCLGKQTFNSITHFLAGKFPNTKRMSGGYERAKEAEREP